MHMAGGGMHRGGEGGCTCILCIPPGYAPGRNQGFSYNFCLMIEGSGSIPLTNGSRSGSWKPKNIRIRNTAYKRNDELTQWALYINHYSLRIEQELKQCTF